METNWRDVTGGSWRPPTTTVPVRGLDATEVAPGAGGASAWSPPPTVVAPTAPASVAAPATDWGRPAPLAPPPPSRRRWVTVPLALAAVAFASAEPVVMVPVLGIVGGPALATVGDALAQPERHQAWALAWWARNVAIGAARSLGGLVVLAVTVSLWFGTQAIGFLEPAGPWTLRIGGGLAAWLVVLAIGRGGPRYRSDLTLDAVVAKLVPAGRPTVAAGVLALVCVAIACMGLLLRPEAWPLG